MLILQRSTSAIKSVPQQLSELLRLHLSQFVQSFGPAYRPRSFCDLLHCIHKTLSLFWSAMDGLKDGMGDLSDPPFGIPEVPFATVMNGVNKVGGGIAFVCLSNLLECGDAKALRWG